MAEAAAELREVRGPSAFGGGARRFFELLYLMSVNNFKRTYYGTVLGYLWSLLRPFFLFGILLLVFTRIFRIGADVPNYEVMLLFNVVLFGFFQEATTTAIPSVVHQEGIVRKTQFPRIVIPLAQVMTALLNLGMNLVAVIVFAVFFGVEPMWTWLLFPLLLAVLLLLTTGVSLLLSALFVRHRDTMIIWSVAVTGLFYGSAVLYPIEIVTDEWLRDLLAVNPLTLIFVQAREWLVDAGAPSAIDVAGEGFALLGLAVLAAACALGLWVFTREARRAAEEL